MNNVDYINDNTFLIPYYKQFIKLLKNNKIMLYGNKSEKDIEFLNSKNLIIIDGNEHAFVDGIILNSYFECDKYDLLANTLNKITSMLKEEGIILLINNKHIVSEETIKYLFKENYECIEELIGDDKWNFILYQKRTTK